MKRNFRLTYEAETDLAGIARHIATDNPRAASRFLEGFERACELLATMPELGHPRTFAHPDLECLRSFPIKGFEKYLVFYRVAPPVLEVVRVLHGARDLPALFGEGG
jgi:toxin ParE1/3/4